MHKIATTTSVLLFALLAAGCPCGGDIGDFTDIECPIPVTATMSHSGDESTSSSDSASSMASANESNGESSTGDMSTGEVLSCDVAHGKAFGPCYEGLCDPGLICYGTDIGSICQPPCTECDAHEWDSCLDTVSSQGDKTSCQDSIMQCRPKCTTSATCLGGTVCDQLQGICLWPYPAWCVIEIGGPFGRCEGDGTCFPGLTCQKSIGHSICLPGCPDCLQEFDQKCVKAVNSGPGGGGGFTCEDNLCQLPCDVNPGSCSGGTICNMLTKTCMWP